MALSFLKGLFNVASARKILVSPVMPAELKRQLLDYALEQGKADDRTLELAAMRRKSTRSLLPHK